MADRVEDKENSIDKAGEALPENAPEPVLAPAYIPARNGVEEDDAPERQGESYLAAFLLASKKMDDDEQDADENPSIKVAGTTIGGTDGDDDIFKPDLSGAGWITCSDGTKVRDDGTSIYAPGKTLSPGQAEMIIQLAAKKGWKEIYPFRGGSNRLNEEAASMLSQLIAARNAPLSCCNNQAQAKSFSKIVERSRQATCRAQYEEYERCKGAGNKTPAP